MILETAVTLVIVFSALVVVHEFGHFLLAKLCGIRVEEFAIGFGPKLARILKRGDTDYNLRWIPLGGFVKLSGMESGEDDLPYGFTAQPIWKRALVIFSGPLFSFLFAVVTFVAIGFIWGFMDLSTSTNRIAMVSPETEAARMGLRAGDRVLSINGIPMTTGKLMTDYIHKHPGDTVKLRVSRRGELLQMTGVPRTYVQYLGVGWSFQQGNQPTAKEIVDEKLASKLGIEPKDKLLSINGTIITGGQSMIATIKKTNPAASVKLGLARGDSSRVVDIVPPASWVEFGGVKWAFPGSYVVEVKPGGALSSYFKFRDRLTEVNGAKITSGEDLLKAIEQSPSKELAFSLKREGETETVYLPLQIMASTPIAVGLFDSMGLLGFIPEPVRRKPGFIGSIKEGLGTTWEQAAYLVKTLTSHRIKEEVGGPVMIAKVTSSSVARGIDSVVAMMASLSLSLAVVNLIPLPILDGGHLLLLAVEALRRRRLTAVQMQAWQMAGLAILGVIVVLVLWSDIFKITRGLVPQ